MKIKPFLLISGVWLLLIFFTNSCQQSSTNEAEAKEVTPLVEKVPQEKTISVAAYSIQDKSLLQTLKRSKGLTDLTLEVRYPNIVGKKGSAFIDSLNADYEERAKKMLQEVKSTKPDEFDVLFGENVSDDPAHYIFQPINVRIGIWQGRVLNIVQEEYILTNEEQDLGMNNYVCLSYSLPADRLLNTEEVFKSEFIQVLKLKAKELLEANSINEYLINTELEYLQVDVRFLVLREDGSFAYLYGVPIPHGRVYFEEIEFTLEEAKQFLKI